MTTETLITCPAPLEMLRPGSTCRLARDIYRGAHLFYSKGTRVIFLKVCINEALVAVMADDDVYHAIVPFDALEMDLTDATGRAHAAWWIIAIGRWELVREVNLAPRWINPDTASISLTSLASGGFYSLMRHLDPDDDTRLPDGSRVVDALALKTVVEHLLSQMETTP